MKKTLLSLLFISLSFSCFAQSNVRRWRGNYLLLVTVEDVSRGNAVLKYTHPSKRGGVEEVKMTSTIADSQFAFSSFIDEPVLATLEVENVEYQLFIDPTQMKVTLNNTSETIKVENSWSNDDCQKIEELRKQIIQISDTKDSKLADMAELNYASVQNNSFVVLIKMLELSKPEDKYFSDTTNKQMIGILMNMSDALKDTPTGIDVSSQLFISSVNMYTREQKKENK